jgi:YD repeat-containing protein
MCLSSEGAPNCNVGNKTFNWPGVSTPNGTVPHLSSVVNIGSPNFKCRLVRADNGQGELLLDFHHQPHPGTFCPANSTLVGTQCRCDDGYTQSGSSCRISAKNRGCNDLNVKNPCNAGSGSKFQLEPLYRGFGKLSLVEQLSYNSQTLDHSEPVWTGAYGRAWKGHYERQVAVVGGFARVGRPDGRELEFQAPSSGNVYVADPDVSDRLEKLTDGSGNTIGWKYYVAADESTELYGPTGKLLSITNLAGLALTLTYSDASTPPSVAPVPGLLIAVTDPWGRALNYVYNSQQRIVRLTNPANDAYDFGYDFIGNLASITFPDEKVRTFVYNEPEHTQGASLPHSLTGIIDENENRFGIYKYNSQGRVVSSEHAGGAEKVTLDYTSPGVSTKVTDALGVERTYGLTTLFGVIKNNAISGPACPSCGPAAQTHDANGNVDSRNDWNGNRTEYTFNTRNLEESRREAVGTQQARTITTEWHSTFRLPARIAEPLRLTTNVYDADGTQCGARGALCSRTVQATGDTNGSQGLSVTPVGTPRTWTYLYNGNGDVLSVNGPRTDVPDVTTYTYYPNNASCSTENFGHPIGCRGQIHTITNALSQVTSIGAYNAHGQPVAIEDPNGLVTLLTYDARQRLEMRKVGEQPPTTFEYIGSGQLKKVTLPDSSWVLYDYDPAHRLTQISDNLGNRIVYPTSEIDAMGNWKLEEVRDASNQLVQKRSRVFNNLNRLFQELGAQGQLTTQYGYDNQGNVTSVTQPDVSPAPPRTTTNEYDALNRLKQVTSPAPIAAVTQYAHNGLDALTQVTQLRALPNQNLVTTYEVNGLGNLTLQTSPDTGNTENSFDAAGNLRTQKDAKNQITTYDYDALNRVTLITFHDASKQIYTYDEGPNGIGRLTSIVERNAAGEATSRIAYGYDKHGRIISDTRTVNGVHVTTYRYDSAGRVDQITYPSGRVVTYTFDGMDRVSQIAAQTAGQVQTIVSNVT